MGTPNARQITFLLVNPSFFFFCAPCLFVPTGSLTNTNYAWFPAISFLLWSPSVFTVELSLAASQHSPGRSIRWLFSFPEPDHQPVQSGGQVFWAHDEFSCATILISSFAGFEFLRPLLHCRRRSLRWLSWSLVPIRSSRHSSTFRPPQVCPSRGPRPYPCILQLATRRRCVML